MCKGPTCFKSASGSMIDLFLTTNKCLFQKTNTFKTAISHHHHLMATVLKTTYERFPPKFLTYRSYEHSWNDSSSYKCSNLRQLYTIPSQTKTFIPIIPIFNHLFRLKMGITGMKVLVYIVIRAFIRYRILL